MSALLAWRQRYGIQPGIAAVVLGVTPELLNRIECGEVDPEPTLAVRIHIVTGGEVPPSTWHTVQRLLLEAGRIHAITAKGYDGTWGVQLFLGNEPIAQLAPDAAELLAADLSHCAVMARNPPAPMPLFPMDKPV